MKLAEALILRADAQKRMQQLRTRFANSARVQEGEEPPEDPHELLAEYGRTLDTFTGLVQRINRTNAITLITDEAAAPAAGSGADLRTISDAIAERDAFKMRLSAIQDMIDAASSNESRYSRSEIRYVRIISVKTLRGELDALSAQLRQLDMQLQARNWQIDLID